MYVFSTSSNLVRALIFLCLIQWSITQAKKFRNSRDRNDKTNISTNYQHEKLTISNGKYKSNVISTENDLDVVHKRQKRCLLTMMALGSVAGFSDWFWHIVGGEELSNEEDESIHTTTTTTTRKPDKIIGTRGSQSCVTQWGSCVSGGKPDHNLIDAQYIMNVKYSKVSGIWTIQFRHPITKNIIQLPRDTPDEYVVSETRQVFIIFVDHQGRTFLIFKRRLRPDEVDDIRPSKMTDWFVTNPDTNMLIIFNYLFFLSNTNEKNVGNLVIHNVPEYDPSTATFIMDGKKKIVNGIWVVEFLHPPTKVLVKVPMDMGDDYVVEETHQIFKVFVDFNGKTFMIFVGLDSYHNDGNNPGVPSINKVPPYNIGKAIYIYNVVQKVVNGILMIDFIHPGTGEIIQVPFNVGDEYIDPSTKKVFLIFVDNKGQTLLIFKGLLRTDITFFQHKEGSLVIKNKPSYNIKHATFIHDTRHKCGLDGKPVLEWIHPVTKHIIQLPLNIGQVYIDKKTRKVYVIYVDVEGRTFLILKGFDGKDRLLLEDKNIVGRLVIEGVPKYDLAKALIVMDTELKVLADGSSVIVFEHPITKQRVQIPPNIGDEYNDKPTHRIFIIFVDVEGKTLLIFKGWRQYDDRQDDIDPLQIGYLVVNGVPRWNLQTAIIVRKTVQKIGTDGTIVIEFNHPIIKRNVQIPRDKGDDYEMKETGEIFKIFVGHFHRTLLILKSPGSVGKHEDLKWGNKGVKIVIRGVPKYDMGRAIFIEKTEQMLDEYGRILVVFKHPIGKQRISLLYYKGDVYVNPRTKRVYKICVDKEGQTMMVYIRNERDKKEQWITAVKRGFPAYDLSKAIVITDAEIKIKRRGTFVSKFLEFRHPFSRLMLRVSTAGADRYVQPGTKNVFIICIDNRGRTLLILEGTEADLMWQKDPDIQWLDIHQETNTQSTKIRYGSGSIVIDGYPPYDIARATYVFKVKAKRRSDGIWIILFKHPKTSEIIRVPMYGGDEYVHKTGQVFIIYVDHHKETLLILKPDVERSSTITSNHRDGDSESQENRHTHPGFNDENINRNINININRNTNRNLNDEYNDF